jgi:hypothetical protein
MFDYGIQLRWCGAAVLMLSLGAAVAGMAQDSGAAGIPTLTVCQALRDHARYRGQTVIVVGRAVEAPDGSWIDEGCGLRLTLEDRAFPAAISTTYDASEFAPPPTLPKGFKWDKRALQRALDEVQTTTRLQAKAYWCAVYGRLEVDPIRHIDLGNGRSVTTVGYGHEGAAGAQLVGPADGVLRLKGK